MFWRARLFALYLLSLRLDTSFHSLHTVIQFVNQCNTVITALTKVSLPEVWLRMLCADRGALGSSTGCLAHGSSLRAAMELIAQPEHPIWSALLPVRPHAGEQCSMAWRCRNRTTGALREENQNEQQDLLLLWPWL